MPNKEHSCKFRAKIRNIARMSKFLCENQAFFLATRRDARRFETSGKQMERFRAAGSPNAFRHTRCSKSIKPLLRADSSLLRADSLLAARRVVSLPLDERQVTKPKERVTERRAEVTGRLVGVTRRRVGVTNRLVGTKPRRLRTLCFWRMQILMQLCSRDAPVPPSSPRHQPVTFVTHVTHDSFAYIRSIRFNRLIRV